MSPISLIISPLTADLLVGEQLQLTVLPNPHGVKWSCTACNVASVDSQGLVTALSAGEATITGRRGNVSTSVTVVVTDVDPPPDPEPQPPTVALVAAYGSTDEDTWGFSTQGTAAADGDSIVDATIDFGDGTGEQTLPLPLAAIIEHNWPAGAADYPVTLAIETALGQYGETTILARVLAGPPPDPPVDPLQSPIPSWTFISGQFTHAPVTMSTLGTYDPDGDALVSYTVDWDDGTVETVSIPTGILPQTLQHTYTAPGVYTTRFTVRDDDGSEGSIALDVIIVDQPTTNIPPIARLVQLSGAFAGDAFAFSTVGSTDPDGTLVQWTFQNGAGEVQGPFAGPPPAQITSFAYPLAGSYTAALTVKDNDGVERTAEVGVTVAPIPTPPGDSGYFDTITAMPQCILRRTLDTQDQLIKNNGQSAAPWVVADPAMQAAKVIIPPFGPDPSTTLASGINSSTLTITFSPSILIANGRAYRIDNEVVVARRIAPGVFEFDRGQAGTSAAAHLAGAAVYSGTSSLLSQVRIPVNTQPGHTYFFGIEAYHTPEIQLTAWKCWQHSLGPNTGIWCEVNNSKPDLGGGLGIRAYQPGPNQTDQNPLSPRVGAFSITANRWFRLWTFFDQRPAIPLVSLWAGDAATGAIQLINSVQEQYEPNNSPSIDKFWLEYNTSVNSIVVNANRNAWNRRLFVLRDLELSQANALVSVSGLNV